MLKSTQCTQTILGAAGSGASGSSTMRARLFIPDGRPDHASGGDRAQAIMDERGQDARGFRDSARRFRSPDRLARAAPGCRRDKRSWRRRPGPDEVRARWRVRSGAISRALRAARSFSRPQASLRISRPRCYPVLPVFLTQTLKANASIVGLVEGFAQAAQNIDRPADALVRTMARHRTAGAGSGAGRTQLIYATAIHLPQILPPRSIWRTRSLGSGLSISWSGKRNFAG